MPRNASAKKAAAQQWGKIKAMDAVSKGGKYLVARVEKSLGFCQFLANLQMADGSLRPVTVLVRGKNKGGRFCSTRIEPGCYVVVDGDPGKVMEVITVANKQSDLDVLRRAGRLSDRLAGTQRELSEYFDSDDDESDPERAKQEKDAAEKEVSRAEELVSRYRLKAETGIRLRADINMAESKLEEEDDSDYVDSEEDGTEAPQQKPRRRRQTQKAAIAPTNLAATLRLTDAEAEAEIHAAALGRRKIPDRWEEDEIDIDAI